MSNSEFEWLLPSVPKCLAATQFDAKCMNNKASLNVSVGSIADLKPDDPGFKSPVRQGYICWQFYFSLALNWNYGLP
jgi:hypothetical protein